MHDPGFWYVAQEGQQMGPYPTAQVHEFIQAGQLHRGAYVCGQGMTEWIPLTAVPMFAQAISGDAGAPPAPPPAPGTAHEIDYAIYGNEMQYVEITLDPQEAAVAEAGALMYMEPGIEMETIFGDGSEKQGGFFSKLVSAGKRMLTGESLFMTIFGNSGGQRSRVAFAAPYPGQIIAVDLRQHGNTILCQKDSFVCAAKGVSVEMAFQKKLGAGFFGGEGFIMQKLEGDGLAFMHAGGSICERQLAPGESLRFDTGCLVAYEQTVNYDVQFVGGIKSALFGGEGLFFATVTGPGKVWLQSLPFSRLAGRILAEGVKHASGRGQGEGSVLGGLGLGD